MEDTMKHHRLVLPVAMIAIAALFILIVVSHSGAALPADQIN
jgi:hypothetical protein